MYRFKCTNQQYSWNDFFGYQAIKFTNYEGRVVYRSPDSKSDWMDRFDDHIYEVISTNKNIDFVLMGVFNIGLCKCNKLQTMMEVNGLHQVITQPTRVPLKSETLIEYIYVNEKKPTLLNLELFL